VVWVGANGLASRPRQRNGWGWDRLAGLSVESGVRGCRVLSTLCRFSSLSPGFKVFAFLCLIFSHRLQVRININILSSVFASHSSTLRPSTTAQDAPRPPPPYVPPPDPANASPARAPRRAYRRDPSPSPSPGPGPRAHTPPPPILRHGLHHLAHPLALRRALRAHGDVLGHQRGYLRWRDGCVVGHWVLEHCLCCEFARRAEHVSM